MFRKWIYQSGMVAHACNPSYSGGRGRKVVSLRSAHAIITEILLKKKRGWGCGSSGRVLALVSGRL
jgi:hypothetical protein